jgi:predicted transposase YbfD/YdcC
MIHSQGTTVAQLRIPAGTTETTPLNALLDPVDLTDAVVTADAAHTQHATASYLRERDAPYVLMVKGNQPTVLAQVHKALPAACPEAAEHVGQQRGHGRITRRSIWTAPATGVDFPGVAQVFRIRRDVFDLDGQRVGKQIVHGLSSLAWGQPARVASLVQLHWGVENLSHYVRDVTFAEDAQQAYTGGSAHAMAAIRNLAISLIRLAGHTDIKRTTERIAADRTRIFDILHAATVTLAA